MKIKSPKRRRGPKEACNYFFKYKKKLIVKEKEMAKRRQGRKWKTKKNSKIIFGNRVFLFINEMVVISIRWLSSTQSGATSKVQLVLLWLVTRGCKSSMWPH
jgi:hypothetical protein